MCLIQGTMAISCTFHDILAHIYRKTMVQIGPLYPRKRPLKKLDTIILWGPIKIIPRKLHYAIQIAKYVSTTVKMG